MTYFVLLTLALAPLLSLTVKAQQVDICSLPAETGPCRAFFTRYYYNPRTRSCQTFVYGGCRGNQNNFRTLSECSASCICNAGLNGNNRRETNKQGKCYDASRSIFYDATSGRCRRTGSVGCNGSGNRFSTTQQCNAACKLSRCFLPAEVGVCRAAFTLYFYNTKNQRCERFTYGGCRGNLNKFRTLKQCNQRCAAPIRNEISNQNSPPRNTDNTPTNQDSICFLPKVIGICRAAFRRYYYNSQSGRCELFLYGGCQGNANNFETEAQCTQRCVQSRSRGKRSPVGSLTREECEQAPKQGICQNFVKSFFYNVTIGTCEEFFYGGCAGNKNRFKTKERCQVECELPGQIGVTGSIIGGGLQQVDRRVNSQTVDILFGGSVPLQILPSITGQNAGVKNTQFSITPSPLKTKDQDFLFPKFRSVCALPKAEGPCYGLFPSYYYNKEANECQQFFYGGCQGNANRFKTKEWCDMTCKQTDTPVVPFDPKDCALPSATGPCRGFFPKFYYNSTSGRCEEFVYGGCRGNGNRFDSVAECEMRCAETSTVV